MTIKCRYADRFPVLVGQLVDDGSSGVRKHILSGDIATKFGNHQPQVIAIAGRSCNGTDFFQSQQEAMGCRQVHANSIRNF